MKKIVAGVSVVLLAVVVAAPAQAEMVGVGFSVFGGYEIPVGQDDAAEGSTYGLRVPLQVINMLRFEPWVSRINVGDYEIDGIGGPFTFEGGTITSYAVNVIFGTPITTRSIGIGAVLGIGKHQYKVDDVEIYNRVGYNGGLDLSVGIGDVPLIFNGRAEVLVVPLEDGGSRKYALFTLGATYRVGL